MVEKLNKIIKGINIVNHNEIIYGDIYIKNNKIEKIVKKSSKENPNALYCIPAFIDQHTHGGYGLSFDELDNCSEKEIENYFKGIKKEGVCGIFATTVTNTIDKLISIGKKINEINSNYMLGWHIEGPYISIERKGAHNPKLIKPATDNEMKKINDVTDCKKIMTIAPEVGNNLNIIKKWSDKFYFSIGHSNADDEITSKAFDYGVIQSTHLYNAMRPYTHREPGVTNNIIGNKRMSEIISDGVHVDPIVVKETYNVLGSNNIIVVSDSLPPKGLKDGQYKLGPMDIFKIKDHCYLENKTTLSGSAVKYIDLVKSFKKITNCDFKDIVRVSSYNTANNLKLRNYGVIKNNIKCNLLIVDKNLNIKENLITN